jgi:HemY protein
MTRVLVFVLLLALLALGAAWIADTPGEVSVALGGWKMETSPAIAVLAVIAFSLALLLVWTVLRLVFRLPSIVGLASRARRRARGFQAVSRGMVAVGAGDQRTARRYADDAQKLLGREPLALLLKAQAAQMAGDRPGAEGAFKQMLNEPETQVLGLRGLFVEARRKGDTAAARAYAAEAARLAPSVPWSGEALLEYQCADRDWGAALSTLDRAAKTLDKAQFRRQRAVLLTADAIEKSEHQPDAALARALDAVKLAPDLVPAVALAARLLARRGDVRKSAKMIEQAWITQPHPDLADAYIVARPGDAVRDRLARADKLLALRPSETEGRIAVAKAALAARDTDRAREVLQPLLEDRPTVRVCLMMAEIEDSLGAAGAVREWLARASRAPRDPAWLADGVIADRWAPVSPVTGRLDAFVWGTPVEQLSGPVEALPRLQSTDAVLADADEPVSRMAEETKALAPPAPREVAPPPAPASLPVTREPPAPVPLQPPAMPSQDVPRNADAIAASAAAVPASGNGGGNGHDQHPEGAEARTSDTAKLAPVEVIFPAGTGPEAADRSDVRRFGAGR